MKTLIKKLKSGVLLAWIVLFTSCGSGVSLAAGAGLKSINQSLPAMALIATKYTGEKMSEYFRNSSASKTGQTTSVKKTKKATRGKKALPISIGMAGGAQLVSSSPTGK